MKRMSANNARLLGAAALAALAIGGVSTTANASPTPMSGHRHGDHTVGQHNSTSTHHSPTIQKGFQNAAPTSAGGQNSIMNAFCRKAPCRISQKVNMLPWDVSAYISLGPSDYLVIP